MTDDISDTLEELTNKVSQNSDIGRAMQEFFKDEIDSDSGFAKHDIDLRSRLIGNAIRGHSVINFLGSLEVLETPYKESLAEGLNILSISLKRHVISHEGKSRQEIIDLFKSQSEAQKANANFNILQPMGQGK